MRSCRVLIPGETVGVLCDYFGVTGWFVLAGKTLGCWCQRLDEDSPACHAEVIAEHADRLARDQSAGGERDQR